MLVSIFAIPAELHSVACGKHQGCKTLAMLQCLSNGRHAVFINFIRLLPTCQSLALINASEHGWNLKIQGREAAVVYFSANARARQPSSPISLPCSGVSSSSLPWS